MIVFFQASIVNGLISRHEVRGGSTPLEHTNSWRLDIFTGAVGIMICLALMFIT